MRIFLREVLITLLLAVVAFFILQTTVQTFIVIGPSMEPTLENGQRLLVNRVVYKLHEPERGDVIVFHPPESVNADYIKRIIGIPGDRIEVKKGAVYLNGTKLKEEYVKDKPSYISILRELSDGEYFVLGDNRNHSNDSHNDWTVPRQNIIGKAWLSIWPQEKWGIISPYPLSEQLDSTEASCLVSELSWQ